MSTFSQHSNILLGGTPPSIERLWADAGFSPNPQQREAILHTDGPLYLTAGPGSGKTRVLLWRTVNLVVYHDVQPGEIFLSTFTEKAARQLKEGLRALLGMVSNYTGRPYDLSGMYIGTVHSLCQRMLTDRRRFFPDRHRHRPPTLLDELGQYFHIYNNRNWESIVSRAGMDAEGVQKQINLIFGKNSISKHNAVINCMTAFNRFSEELIEPDAAREKLESGAELQGVDIGDILFLLDLYEGYLQSLQPAGTTACLTDFALVQKEAFHVLNQFPDAGKVFKHVIVDEYQDTNTIQERIFFKLAEGSGNICVVGDDDQALYRFRGATVENFVQFPQRCEACLGRTPHRIALNTNYRSREDIVTFYTTFMQQSDWRTPDGKSAYRVMDKEIQAHRSDSIPAVAATTPSHPNVAVREIAEFVRELIDTGKVENPNQIAFLYPSLKSQQVKRMKEALEMVGLRVYAPRAGRFLEVDEAMDVFGVLLLIFGRPTFRGMGQDVKSFREWLNAIEERAEALSRTDPRLKQFITDKQAELRRALADYQALMKVVQRKHWDVTQPYGIAQMKRALVEATGLSETGRRLIASAYLDRIVHRRIRDSRPLSLNYIIRRATSLDWNVLDLFYRLLGFDHFKHMIDQAETHGDEGPVANLGLITQYLQRFIDERVPIITANLLVDKKFQALLFSSYLFALFRLGESELENPEDPFPRGRIPFLTIHQSKGLEFPVVVLGNPRKDNRGPAQMERIIRPLLTREPGEPLDRMPEFDIMRMFYVALSRAQNLLVIAHFTGRGQRMTLAFTPLLDDEIPRLPDFDIDTIPQARIMNDTLPHVYSFTADFLQYKKCPRQYMIFRKYDFVPSRAQTMFFGSLVHRTLEDLHHELIRRRNLAPSDGGHTDA